MAFEGKPPKTESEIRSKLSHLQESAGDHLAKQGPFANGFSEFAEYKLTALKHKPLANKLQTLLKSHQISSDCKRMHGQFVVTVDQCDRDHALEVFKEFFQQYSGTEQQFRFRHDTLIFGLIIGLTMGICLAVGSKGGLVGKVSALTSCSFAGAFSGHLVDRISFFRRSGMRAFGLWEVLIGVSLVGAVIYFVKIVPQLLR